MIIRLDCERARRALPDLATGQAAGAGIAGHLEGCASCAAEFQALRRVLAETAHTGLGGVPDPGEAYWDAFLPSVKARIEGRDRVHGAGRRARSFAAGARLAAAAAVMALAAGLSAWMQPWEPPAGSAGDGATALERFPRSSGGLGAEDLLLPLGAAPSILDGDVLLATGGLPDVSLEEVIEAVEAIDCPPGPSSLCAEEGFQRALEGLDEGETARMRAELLKELG